MKDEKSLNKRKSLFKRMIDFTKANRLNFIFLFILGYALYEWMLPKLCLSSGCFLSGSNIFLLLFTGVYIYLIFKILVWVKSDENLDSDIRKADLNLKRLELDIKKLNKEKLELEINKLKK